MNTCVEQLRPVSFEPEIEGDNVCTSLMVHPALRPEQEKRLFAFWLVDGPPHDLLNDVLARTELVELRAEKEGHP